MSSYFIQVAFLFALIFKSSYMKNKSFTQTRAFFWLFCIVINIVLLLGIVLGADASPRKYKGHNKQERIFQKRKSENLSEQERIYNSHQIKHFKKNKPCGKKF